MIYNITSRSNPAVMRAAGLKEKKYRDAEKVFYFEGRKLFSEARENGMTFDSVFVREDLFEKEKELFSDLETYVVPASVYNKLSEEMAPQGIFSILRRPALHEFAPDFSKADGNETFFFACSVRDPGNLGTIIRSANALGIDRLILSSDCADLYNSKTVRASMGALFRQKIAVTASPERSVEELKQAGYAVYAAAADDNAVSVTELGSSNKNCFIVGNEGHGLSPRLTAACTGTVTIPMRPGTESLNVSAAAVILMWEGFRGRSDR